MNLTTSDRYSAYKSARRDITRAYGEYEDMARACYREGYRPRVCIHGVDNWSDYDMGCSSCELGSTRRDWEIAVYRARCERYAEMMDDYLRLAASVARCGASNTDAVVNDLHYVALGLTTRQLCALLTC